MTPPDPRDPSLSRTDWSLLGHLTSGDEQREAAALDRLVRRYWTAVYAYIRQTGRDVHQATDLTQAFVADVLLGRRLMHSADRNKGRFRSYLLHSLENFLREQHRHETRTKRRPARGAVVGLEEQEVAALGAQARTPDEAFEAAWCRELVSRVLRQVADGCRRDGLDVHWAVFDARVIQPMLKGSSPTDYATLASIHDLPSPAHAANLLVTVKRRFAQALRAEIARTVRDPQDVDDELRELLRLLDHRS